MRVQYFRTGGGGVTCRPTSFQPFRATRPRGATSFLCTLDSFGTECTNVIGDEPLGISIEENWEQYTTSIFVFDDIHRHQWYRLLCTVRQQNKLKSNFKQGIQSRSPAVVKMGIALPSVPPVTFVKLGFRGTSLQKEFLMLRCTGIYCCRFFRPKKYVTRLTGAPLTIESKTEKLLNTAGHPVRVVAPIFFV